MSYSTKHGKELLINWCNECVGKYGLSVNDFTTSFTDGTVFCAILASQGALEYDTVKDLSTEERLNTAFSVAEGLSIDRMLDAADMAEPDAGTIVRYLGEIHKHYNPDAAPSKKRDRKKKVEQEAESAPTQTVEETVVQEEAQPAVEQQPVVTEENVAVEESPAVEHTEDTSVLQENVDAVVAENTEVIQEEAPVEEQPPVNQGEEETDNAVSSIEERLKRIRAMASEFEEEEGKDVQIEQTEQPEQTEEQLRTDAEITTDDLQSPAAVLGKLGTTAATLAREQVDSEEPEEEPDFLQEPKIRPKYQHVLSSDPLMTEEEQAEGHGKKERRKVYEEDDLDQQDEDAEPTDLEEMLEDAQDAIAELRDHLEHAENVRDRYKKQYAAALADAHNYEKQAIDLQNRCIENDKEIKHYQSKIADLKKQMDNEAKKHEEDMKNLQDQLAEEADKMEQLLRAEKKLQRELSRLNSLIDAEKKEKAKLESDNKKIQDELSALKSQLDQAEERLKIELKEKEHLDGDVKNLHQVMEKELRVRTKLQQQLKDSQSEREQLKKRLKQQEDEMRKYTTEKKQLTFELQQAQKLLLEERTLRGELEANTNKLRKEYQDLKQKLDAEKQGLMMLEREKLQISDRLREAQRKTDLLNDDLDKASRTVRKQEKLLDKLETQLAEETRKRTMLEKQDLQLLDQVKEWRTKNQDLEWKIKNEMQQKENLERRVRELEIKLKYQ